MGRWAGEISVMWLVGGWVLGVEVLGGRSWGGLGRGLGEHSMLTTSYCILGKSMSIQETSETIARDLKDDINP